MPAKIPAPIGEAFGHWTVIADIAKSNKWLCRCLCGLEKPVGRHHLKSGASTSCGCKPAVGPVKHGMAMSEGLEAKVYRAWKNIKQRTLNTANPKYKTYGARGITLAQVYVDDFKAFYAEVGLPPSAQHSIDRKDNSLGYVPGNMRWATSKEQSRNTSRNTSLTFNGETKTLVEWSETTGISFAVLSARVNKLKWDAHKALTTSVRKFTSVDARYGGRKLPKTEITEN